MTEKRKRGVFGTIVWWIFLLFNALMLFSVIAGWGEFGNYIETATTPGERAGTIIGSAIGIWILLMIWLVGDIVLGILVLLTRGKKEFIQETRV